MANCAFLSIQVWIDLWRSPFRYIAMKTIRVLAALSAFVSSFLFLPVGHAEGEPPKETPLFVTLGENNDRMDERLFPVGWSDDGKFAWISRRVEEASDDGMWFVRVLDTAKNKMVEDIKMTFKDETADGVTKFWAQKEKEIQALLKKHGINREVIVMDHLPVVLGKLRNHLISATVTAKESQMELGGTGVKSFIVNLRQGEKSAVIYKKTYETYSPFAVALAGCFYSPNQKFGAIVVTSVSRGYEGPPHPRWIEALAGFAVTP
jgi:hypothetical protein